MLFKIIIVGRKLEEKELLTWSTWGIIGFNCLSDQAQSNPDNLNTWRTKEVEGYDLLEEFKEQLLLRRQVEGYKSWVWKAEKDHDDA